MDDGAEVIGRAVAGVLAQTFAHHEIVVVDHGRDPRTATAVGAVADHRVRLVKEPSMDRADATRAGVEAAHGRWVALLEASDEVVPGWLARLGRLIDATDADFVSCGGEQHHRDGSLSRILPTRLDLPTGSVRACLRSGAFAVTRRSLLAAHRRAEVDGLSPRIDQLCAEVLQLASDAGLSVAHSPEPLVRWNDPPTTAEDDTGAPGDDERLRLTCSLQGLDALARTPIPDGALLTRYAVTGGLAAARLDDWHEARRLFRLARRLEPAVWRHWARWTLSLVPPVADRVWQPVTAGG